MRAILVVRLSSAPLSTKESAILAVGVIIIERQEDTCPCGLFSQRLTPSKASLSLYPCCIDWMLYHVKAGS